MKTSIISAAALALALSLGLATGLDRARLAALLADPT